MRITRKEGIFLTCPKAQHKDFLRTTGYTTLIFYENLKRGQECSSMGETQRELKTDSQYN